MRGALQTTVNGGNITDAKLSGPGVTAGNFGPIDPGVSTAGLSVVFAPNTVGALNGQTVRILNNFDNVADQTLSITGAAYRLAAASVPGTVIDFGIVHVGETAERLITVNNAAAADGFSEALDGGFSEATGHVSTAGSFVGVAAGASSTAPKVILNTATTGSKTGTATLAFTSNGAGTSGLPGTALPSLVISATGQVNNFAAPQFLFISGAATLSGSGTTYTLDFGRHAIGEALPAVMLSLINSAPAPADTLAGSFVTAAPGFTLAGFGPLNNVGAGQSRTLSVALNTNTPGTFSQTISFNGFSQNGGGFNGALAPVTINLTGEITAVPKLNVQITDTTVMLSWPLAEQDWVLKKSDNLADWTTVTDPVIDTVTEHTVTTPRGSDARMFYRLQK